VPPLPAYRPAVIPRSLALAALALAACARPSAIDLHPSRITVSVSGESRPFKRVVSLVPSVTEDLFAVGAGATVLGVSEYTDYPPRAQRLPVVATFASIATERIVALHPDVAIGITAQDRLAGDLRRAGVNVVLLHDDSFADIFANLVELGAMTGHERDAKALVARLHARTAALVRTVKRRGSKPAVFVVLGTAPVFTVGAGSYIANLIEMAGGRNAAGDIRAAYARYSAEALVARQPDLLIVDPTVRLNDVLGQAPWNALRAVQRHRVYTLPDAAILERPGPRYNEGLSWLIATLDEAGR